MAGESPPHHPSTPATARPACGGKGFLQRGRGQVGAPGCSANQTEVTVSLQMRCRSASSRRARRPALFPSSWLELRQKKRNCSLVFFFFLRFLPLDFHAVWQVIPATSHSHTISHQNVTGPDSISRCLSFIQAPHSHLPSPPLPSRGKAGGRSLAAKRGSSPSGPRRARSRDAARRQAGRGRW